MNYLAYPALLEGEHGYKGNVRLKRPGCKYAYTISHIEEYARCSDPETGLAYFLNKYVKVEVPDGQIIPFEPYPYQVRFADAILKNRFILALWARQSGKCVHINTLVTIRNTGDGRIEKITVGELYDRATRSRPTRRELRKETGWDGLSDAAGMDGHQGSWTGLRGVSDVWFSGGGVTQTPLTRSWNKKRRLLGTSVFSSVFWSTIIQDQWGEESRVGSPGAPVSILEEIREGGRLETDGSQGETHDEREREYADVVDLLHEEGGWGRGAGIGDAERSPEHILSGKVRRETRPGGRPQGLEGTAGEVAEHHVVEVGGGDRRDQSEEDEKQWIGLKSRDRDILTTKGEDSSVRRSVHSSSKSKNIYLRHETQKSIDRIQRRLLAREAQHEIRPRFLYASKVNSRRDLGEGSPETRTRHVTGIRSASDLGGRIQGEPRGGDTKMHRLSDTVDRKFVDSVNLENIEIWTDSGWRPAPEIHLTVPYEIYVLRTATKTLRCADDHIVFTQDMGEIFVKNLIPGESLIVTDSGPEEVISVERTGIFENMYDVSVDHEDHRYYTDGVLSHNTTAAAAIILWHLLFKRNYTVVLAANKLVQAVEILDRIKLAVEWIPLWLQQGVITWRGTRIEFENGSKVDAAATSMSGVRGRSISMLYLDEFSHIHPNTQRKFYESVYPAISAGKETKLLITTTPNGLDMFHKLWEESRHGENDFVRVESHWSEKPGRDEKWAAAERARLGDDGFAQEYDTEFLGSSATLINGRILSVIPKAKPIEKTTLGIKIFARPEVGHNYVATVDVSRGLGLDYQAMTIVDVSTKPWEVVATYRNNMLPASLYHEIIYDAALYYNRAMVLVETNDVGLRVAEDLLQNDEYDNVLMTQVKGKYGTKLGGGFGPNNRYGVKTSVQTKKIGCAVLKQLVERNQLVLNDEDILWELGRFVGKNNTYKAEEGAHDDLVMCLVLFAWLSDQKLFKESVETSDIRKSFIEAADGWAESDVTPFGMIDDGRGEHTGLLMDVTSGEASSKFDPSDPFTW